MAREQLLAIIRRRIVERYRPVRQPVHELADELRIVMLEVPGSAGSDDLAAGQYVGGIGDQCDLIDIVRDDDAGYAQASFMRRSSRRITPIDIGSRPAKGSS